MVTIGPIGHQAARSTNPTVHSIAVVLVVLAAITTATDPSSLLVTTPLSPNEGGVFCYNGGMKEVANSADDMKRIAGDFIARKIDAPRAQGAGALVIGLTGDLGAGKTTFTQGVAEALGVRDVVVSPTFTIERVYKVVHPNYSHLAHLDAYRLETAEELARLGWDNLVSDASTIILIEWADRVREILPADTLFVHFTLVTPTIHEVSY